MYRQYLRDIRARGGGGGEIGAGWSARHTSSRREVRSRSSNPGENGGDSKVDSHKDSKKAIQEVIHGNVSVECPSTARIVRIFTSSTFTDTRHERNALMERVYPALKEVCQQQGYEFQVVDMRWGIRDEATDDHMATELCLREVDLCKRLSTGPYFVTFLSHKYGYRNFPNKIDATEYETLIEDIADDIKNLLNIWFKRDDNAVPATYVLQSISTVLPDFRCDDEDKRKAAKFSWYVQSAKMQDAIVAAAKQKLDKQTAHRYLSSVTEAEINRGIMESKETPFNCLWFHRVITDIDKQEPSKLLSRYKECTGDETKVKESQELLHDLKDKILPKLLAPGHHMPYNITWTDNGIDPENITEHEQYINKLCADFKDEVTKMVQIAIEARKMSFLSNPLYAEVVEHTVFCQSKCQAFHGRQDTLDLVSNYLVGTSTTPFVVYGPSGCGKTSIVAMAAYLTLKIFNKCAGTVIRFIGTTPDSSTIDALLASVISQMWLIFGIEESELPADLKELTEIFYTALSLATETKPLVLLLDSLDQLDPAGGARQLSWMPKKLPEHVKLIVSTLPEAQYESLPAFEVLFPGHTNYIEVPVLKHEEATLILDMWLDQAGRTLTNKQRLVLDEAFKKCPLPLFLKLSFDQTLQWRSYLPQEVTQLQTTVRGCIDALFNRLEDLHGQILVQRALGYLTLSKSGLSESELEDILSCDDDVLNDVYMYWTPPVRRLPPLLLVRLKADLGQYLVDRGADGVRVFYWYHRQFIEAATDKYCSDPDSILKMNVALADYFGGTWANGTTKPYTDRQGNQGSADRKVASQPIKFSTGYNLRKLNNLPHHRTEAKQLDLLKSECLLNFKFLQGKLHASGLRQILNDFLLAKTHYPDDDDDLKIVGECLQLSQDALITFPKELPSHIIGRIRNKPSLDHLLEECKSAEDPFLLPDKPILIPTGGQLVHCLADHKENLTSLDMTSDSKVAITCSKDKSLKIWDTKKGKLLRSIDKFGDSPEKVVLCCNENVILVQTTVNLHGYELAIGIGKFKKTLVQTRGNLHGYELASGIRMFTIEFEDSQRCFCVAGIGKDIICTFSSDSKSAVLYSAKTGHIIEEVKCHLLEEKEDFSNDANALCVGSHRYAACTDSAQNDIFILDTVSKTFVHRIEIFKFNHRIDAMVFSHSGEKLYIANHLTKKLHVYKTDTMKKVEEISGRRHDTFQNFHLTMDGNFLYFSNKNLVVMWNLKSGQRSTFLHQSTDLIDVAIMNMEMAVGISLDHVVRIWDLTRDLPDEEDLDEDLTLFLDEPEKPWNKKEKMEKKRRKIHKDTVGMKVTTMKSRMSKLRINGLKTFANPRYVLVLLSFSADHYLQIRDLGSDKVVRHIRLMWRLLSPLRIQPLDDSIHVILDVEQMFHKHLKKLNLITGDVVSFQGTLSRWVDSVLVLDGREIATATPDRMHIKLYSVEDGHVVSIMKSVNEQQIDYIRANIKGKIIVAGTDEGPAYVYDAASRTCLYAIHSDHLGLKDCVTFRSALLTSDDSFLVLQGHKVPARAYLDDNEEYILLTWDLKNKCLKKELIDYAMYRKYADSEDNDADTGVDVFKLLDDRTVVSNHNDACVRVFDITTGELLKRVQGHQSCSLATVSTSPYFLSHGAYDRDINFRLYDKKTWEIVATFSPDVKMDYVSLTEDGHHVVGYFGKNKSVLWNIMGEGPVPFSGFESFLNVYGNETVKLKLVLDDFQDDDDFSEDAYADSDD